MFDTAKYNSTQLKVLPFIDSIILQINSSNEYSISQIACRDQVWKQTYMNHNSKIMDNSSLIKEYSKKIIVNK